MALKVWLPLDGDLRNLGCSDVTVTNNGATVDNNGKIGKCYNTTNGSITISNLPNPSSISISFWMKRTANTNTRQFMFTAWNGVTCELTTDGTITWAVYRNNYPTITASAISTSSGWVHYCGTFSSIDGLKLYINGELRSSNSNTTAISWNTTSGQIGKFGNYASASMLINDFRIYDHCLSAAEVHEIAMGLVLHYKLDGNSFGNNNILLNTNFDNRYSQTTGWDTAKNGTLLANSWGGYNSGVSNSSTVYHAHLKQIGNEYVYEYIKTANESWLGISQGGLQQKLTAGKIYTFSWEQYSVEGSNYNHGGLYYYKSGATSASFHLGSFSGSGSPTGQWKKFSYTFTAPSDADYSKNMSWYVYGMSGGNGILYTRHLKLEEGSVATPWCPNVADTLYTTLGLGENIVKDSSGYGHNGTIIGNLISSSDTKRYSISTRWNCSSPTDNSETGICYIQIPFSLTTPLQLTVAWWAKPENGYGGNTAHAAFCTSNNSSRPTDYNSTAFHHRDSGFDIYPSDGSGVKRLSFTYITNEWHHYAITYDGTTAKSYKDGTLQTSVTVGTNKTLATFSQLYIGYSQAGGVRRKTLGNYSDFRIYCTPLLDNDIKMLYNVGMKIDNLQNLHTFELNEINGNYIKLDPNWLGKSGTHNGINWQFNQDGSLTLDGTKTTSTASILLWNFFNQQSSSPGNDAIKYIPNGTYIMSTGHAKATLQVDGANDAGSTVTQLAYANSTPVTFTIDNTYAYNFARLHIAANAVFDNFTFYPTILKVDGNNKIKKTGVLSGQTFTEKNKASFYNTGNIEALEFIEI